MLRGADEPRQHPFHEGWSAGPTTRTRRTRPRNGGRLAISASSVRYLTRSALLRDHGASHATDCDRGARSAHTTARGTAPHPPSPQAKPRGVLKPFCPIFATNDSERTLAALHTCQRRNTKSLGCNAAHGNRAGMHLWGVTIATARSTINTVAARLATADRASTTSVRDHESTTRDTVAVTPVV